MSRSFWVREGTIIAAGLVIGACLFYASGCSFFPADQTAPSITVKTPVDNCPPPPVLTAPKEPVYNLLPNDPPDKIEKYQADSIINLEAAYDSCRDYLEVYRALPNPKGR